MKATKSLLLGVTSLVSMVLLLSSCGSSNTLLKEQAYPELYAQKPLSILVMPPINKTDKVEAKEAVYASLYHPLVEQGYYVFSPILAEELLQSESADDAEQFIDGNLLPFRQVFVADAALFTVIKKWEKMSLLSTINVEIEYILKSTKDNKILFQRSADLAVDCSAGVSTSSALVNLLANTVSTALTDHVVGARRANTFVLSDLPNGKYGPDFDKDRTASAGPKEIKGRVQK